MNSQLNLRVTGHSGKTYQLGKELSHGSYARVYHASIVPNGVIHQGVRNQIHDSNVVLKVNFDPNVHRDELKIMKHLRNAHVAGVSKMIDYGENSCSTHNLSV